MAFTVFELLGRNGRILAQFGKFLGLLGRREPGKSDTAEHLIQMPPM